MPIVVSRRGILGGAACLALGAGVAGASACRAEAGEARDRGEALRRTVTGVVRPLFETLQREVSRLTGAARDFEAQPGPATLLAARGAYELAFLAHKRTEVLTFGPSEDVLLAGALDSRPANANKIEGLVRGDAPPTSDLIARQGASSRGLSAVEFLLHDASDPASADARLLGDAGAAQRRVWLRAMCEDLEAQAVAFTRAWLEPGNYADRLATPGPTNGLFPAQKDAIDKLVTAMLYLAELVLVGKLAKPMGIDTGSAPRPELEEAFRSDLSVRAVAANLEAIRAVYLGSSSDVLLPELRTSGPSLSSEIRLVSATLDDRFLEVLHKALREARTFTTPMRQVLRGDITPLRPLHEAAREVKRGIATEVASALGASIGFGYSDTD
jgi:hypothetical protein